jgi:hypothetical protein
VPAPPSGPAARAAVEKTLDRVIDRDVAASKRLAAEHYLNQRERDAQERAKQRANEPKRQERSNEAMKEQMREWRKVGLSQDAKKLADLFDDDERPAKGGGGKPGGAKADDKKGEKESASSERPAWRRSALSSCPTESARAGAASPG